MEYYGEKPKRFSKEWWENYVYYYKKHTIIGICAVLVLGYIIYTDVTATKYDLQIDYISELGIFQEQTAKIEELASGAIDDVTGNDVCDAFVMPIDMAPSNDMQYGQAMQVKYMTEMGYSEGFVFIVSKKYADEMAGSGFFEEASLWTNAEDGAECVSLAGCQKLEGLAMPLDELYVGVRKLRDDEKEEEKAIAKYENGIKFAKFLVE